MTPQERRTQLVHDAETWQGYFPDRATDERKPTPGIDAVHHHFTDYLSQHPEEQP